MSVVVENNKLKKYLQHDILIYEKNFNTFDFIFI
jgi:hypothetical protein